VTTPGPLRVLAGVSGLVGLSALAGLVLLVGLGVLALVLPPTVTHVHILEGKPVATRLAESSGPSSAEQTHARANGPAALTSPAPSPLAAPATGSSPSADPALPVVSAISLTSGSLTGQQRVVITGRHLRQAGGVQFGTTPATGFTVNSDRRITAVSPSGGPGVVDVTVVTWTGGSAASPADRFTYVGPPAVASILPNSGGTDGATSVSITGTGFHNASAVSFGPEAAAGFRVVSSTRIEATPLAAPAGPVDIRVTGPYGTSVATPGDVYTFVAPAAVSQVAPSAGPLDGGTQVTISGVGFTNATAVGFGSVNAQFTVVSDTRIRAIAPPHPAGTVDITVTTPYGTSSTGAPDRFSYAQPIASATVTPPGE
jgi:hypothetical protein